MSTCCKKPMPSKNLSKPVKSPITTQANLGISRLKLDMMIGDESAPEGGRESYIRWRPVQPARAQFVKPGHAVIGQAHRTPANQGLGPFGQ